MKKKGLPVGVTAEMLKSLKEEYGDKRVRVFELPPDEDGEGEFGGVIVVPDRTVYGQFEKFIDKDPDRARKLLIQNCLFPTDKREAVLGDMNLFLPVSTTIIETLPLRKGNFRKA